MSPLNFPLFLPQSAHRTVNVVRYPVMWREPRGLPTLWTLM